MNKVVIVCDLADHFLQNKIFTDDIQKRFPWGESFWIKLKKICDDSDWEIVTSDIFLGQYASKYNSFTSYLISHMTTPSTDVLLKKVNIPLLVYSLESPNVAVSFYSKIKGTSSKYRHSMLFGGIATHLQKSITNRVHILYWPNTLIPVEFMSDWSKRQYLCLIASNKSKFDVLPGKPLKWLRKIIKRLFLLYIDSRYTYLKTEDLYEIRHKAIDYFADTGRFGLFGNNWDKRGSILRNDFIKIEKLAPQQVDSKIETLGRFKFALCFENCVYPGYLTEKIFDCFFAGTIPVYYGAPDVATLIPKGCFIDFRDFNDFKKLDEYLISMPVDEAQSFLRNATTFLSSPEFLKFTDIYLADQVLKMIQTQNSL